MPKLARRSVEQTLRFRLREAERERERTRDRGEIDLCDRSRAVMHREPMQTVSFRQEAIRYAHRLEDFESARKNRQRLRGRRAFAARGR